MHWRDYLITVVCVCVCVCVRVSVDRSGVERLRPQFFTDIHQIMCAVKNVVGSTPIGSETNRKYSLYPILEMCKFQFWRFFDSGCHDFPGIVTNI